MHLPVVDGVEMEEEIGEAGVGERQEGKEEDKEVSRWTTIFIENARLEGVTDRYEHCVPG